MLEIRLTFAGGPSPERLQMMIAYDEFPDHIEIVTIHPIESRQISERVLAGRWTHE